MSERRSLPRRPPAARTARALAATLLCAVVLAPLAAPAAWLDAHEPAPWNLSGAPLPAAPMDLPGEDPPRCRRVERAAEGGEDTLVAARGWRLFREYQGGWGLRIVWGLGAFDAMCRPREYQGFVFAHGVFAGTLAPAPMAARTDASLVDARPVPPEHAAGPPGLVATFHRYAEADPLCCPSRQTTVRYRLEQGDRGPIVVPLSAFTAPARR